MPTIHLTRGSSWTTIRGDPEAVDAAGAALDHPLSYAVPGAMFAEAYADGRWDGRKRLIRKLRTKTGGLTFPAGLTPKAIAILHRKKIQTTLEDARLPGPPVVGSPTWGGPQLRDYQLAAVDAILTTRGGTLRLPIRAGKTVTAAAIAARLGLRTLFLVPSEMLLHQTRKSFEACLPGLSVTCLGDGDRDTTGDVVVATVQALSVRVGTRDFAALQRAFGLLVVDECFPAGTLISGRPIETIRPGDTVDAWDGQAFRRRKVRRTMRRCADGLLTIHAGGRTVTCTPSHPFLTPHGWMPAGRLATGNMVLYSNTHDPLRVVPARDEVLRPQAPVCSGPMQLVRDADDRQHRPAMGAVSPRKGVLPARMPGCLPIEVLKRDSKRHEPPLRFSADEGPQPDASPGSASQTERYASGDRTSPQDPRRQRPSASRSAEDASGRARMADRSGGPYEGATTHRTPDLLQDRHCRSKPSDRDRGGREHPQLPVAPSGRSAQGAVPAWARVESVQVHERGSDGTFGGLCPGGEVFNLEVEADHTYTANGFIVHNCHHTTGDGEAWRDAVLGIEAPWKIGLSATIGLDTDTDGNDLWLEGITGPIVYSVGISDLIDRGFLVRPTVHFVRHGAPAVKGKWSVGKYGDLVVQSADRNAAIVREAVRLADAGHRVLIDVSQVKHGKLLTKLLRTEMPVKQVALLIGSTNDANRIASTQALRSGQIKVIVATIMGEGVDVPEIDVVINAEGGRGEVSTIQRLRNLTLCPGKTEAIVIDLVDDHHPQLRKWTLSRLQIYRAERAFRIKVQPVGEPAKKDGA